MDYKSVIFGLSAVITSGLLAFTITPLVRVLAYKIGAVDVPTDGRRMHTKPIPRIGGLAIYLAFVVTALCFSEINSTVITLCFGGLIIVAMGVLDDIFRLHALVKLLVQVVAAFVAVSQGVLIDFINIGGNYVSLGFWSIPITILWIVGLTNGINLIDGLDGLACGVSAICSLSLLGVTLLSSDMLSALLTAIIAGACIGFLPFNSNPAKIFMGDTGSQFLGFSLSIMAVQGVFKTHTVLSFVIPISIFALPLFDTAFSAIRRIAHGKKPWEGDRGHIHHKLIDMGFGQKQSVRILYAVCGILGMSAIILTDTRIWRAGIVIIAGFAIFILHYVVMRNEKLRRLSGLMPEDKETGDPSLPSADQDKTAAEKSAVTVTPDTSDMPDANEKSDSPSGEDKS